MNRTLRLFALCAAAVLLPDWGRGVPALPEPGLVMYGNVRALSDNQLLTITVAALQITDTNGNTVSLTGASNPPVRIVTVNSMSFYVARVPFATRTIGSPGNQVVFDAPVNAFELRTPSLTYTRQATINGKPAAFANVSQQTFTLTTAERGKFEQVDFLIEATGGGGNDYASFAALYFANVSAPEAQPDFDADGDGMSNKQEYAAGTNPTDPLSALKTILIDPLPAGGFRIVWKSVTGQTYKVEKSTDAQLQNWTQIGSDVVATGATAEFTDTSASGDTIAHYRIRISR